MSRFKQYLLDKIGQLEPNDNTSRLVLYAKVRYALETTEILNTDQKANSQLDFETACREIEEQYSKAPNDQVHKGDQLMTTNHSQQTTKSSVGDQPVKNKPSFLRYRIAAAALILVFGTAIAWYYLRSPFDGEFSGSTRSFSLSATAYEPIERNAAFKLVKEGDVSGLQITGSSFIFGSTPMEIDSNKTYAMKIRAKVLKGDTITGYSMIIAGFATYDSNGKLQKDALANNRYFVGTHRVTVSDGWREYFGTITGEGSERADQFRIGTKSATPVLVANFKSTDASILVDYIRIVECSTADNCQKELDGKLVEKDARF